MDVRGATANGIQQDFIHEAHDGRLIRGIAFLLGTARRVHLDIETVQIRVFQQAAQGVVALDHVDQLIDCR